MSTDNFIKKFFQIILPFVFFYAGYFFMLCVMEIVFHFRGVGRYPEESGGIIHLLCMVSAGIFLLPERKKEKKNTIIVPKKKNTAEWAEMSVLAVGSVIILNRFMVECGIMNISERYQRAAENLYSVKMWEGIVLYGLIVPIVEELLFRGILFSRLQRMFSSFFPAAVLSALCFGIYHGNLPQAMYAAILGLELAFVYRYFGCISAAVLFHGLGNLVIYLSSEVSMLYSIFLNKIFITIILIISCVIIADFVRKNRKIL